MAERGCLVDPDILPFKGPGFLLSGIELETQKIDGEFRMIEHRQVWHVVPVERRAYE